jgi:cell division control protein 6
VAEKTTGRLTIDQVDIAAHQLEIDKTEQVLNSLASQQQLALKACYALLGKSNRKIITGQVYEAYLRLCDLESMRPLTQRRFSDIISSLDLYGLINARIMSMGRYGSTREISSALPREITEKFLKGKLCTNANEEIIGHPTQ